MISPKNVTDTQVFLKYISQKNKRILSENKMLIKEFIKHAVKRDREYRKR